MRERTMMPIVSADDYLGAAKTAPLSLANVKTDLTKYCRSLYLYVALLSKTRLHVWTNQLGRRQFVEKGLNLGGTADWTAV